MTGQVKRQERSKKGLGGERKLKRSSLDQLEVDGAGSDEFGGSSSSHWKLGGYGTKLKWLE